LTGSATHSRVPFGDAEAAPLTVPDRPYLSASQPSGQLVRTLHWGSDMPHGGTLLKAAPAMMNEATKTKLLARLRRISGQLDGVARMVEQDRYCVDVLLQIASAHAALAQAGKLVLRAHVDTCVAEVFASGKPAERKQKIDELMQVFGRYACLGASANDDSTTGPAVQRPRSENPNRAHKNTNGNKP
jgi:CsoR family transcriptional regulator, copper-sensing transcriptional repressor